MQPRPSQRLELLGAAIEASSTGILLVDADGAIVLVNSEIERMFGYGRDELVGQAVEILVPSQFRRFHPDYRAIFLSDPKVRRMGTGRDLFGVRKNGAEVPIEIGLTPVVTDGQTFVLSSIVDITERKAAELQRARLEDQLRHAQKMEAVGRLASGVAHDFKNLLAGILNCGELALHTVGGNGDLKALIDEINGAAERGAALCRQLLDVGRNRSVEATPISVDQSVRSSEQLLRRVIGDDVRMEVELHSSDSRVFGSTLLIDQIVMNLAVNARDAMPRGGTLRITTQTIELVDHLPTLSGVLLPGRVVELRVADNGTGIEESVRAHLFEPFFTTKGPGVGTGLGLFTVYGIVKQMRGAIDVISEFGRGTTFVIYLPCVDLGSTHEVRADLDRQGESVGGSETILVVEDDRLIRMTLRMMLTQLGYQVLVAGDALEAQKLSDLHSGAIDLLLTDMVMPGATGADLARELAARRPGIRTLFMSGYPSEELARQGRIAPGTRTLEKPFVKQSLDVEIRAALNSAPLER